MSMQSNFGKKFIGSSLAVIILMITGCVQNDDIEVTFLNKALKKVTNNGSNTVAPTYTYALGITQGSKFVLNAIDNSTGLASTVATYTLPGTIHAFEVTKNDSRLVVQVNRSNLYVYGLDKTTSPPSLNLLSTATISSVTGSASSLWGVCAAPDGSSAHIVQYGTNRIYSFKIDSNDQVSYAGVTTLAPNYLTNCKVTADSKYVISSGYYANAVTFSINRSTALLTKVMHLAAGDGPSWVEQSADSKFFFIPAQNGNTIKAFEMNLADGTFALVDTVTITSSWPDFLDVRDNGKSVYVNAQGGSVYHLKFDRDTKKFGSYQSITNIKDWFSLDKNGPFYFQSQGANTNIFLLNTDGTLGTQGSTLTGENAFKVINL